jgi:hypothetical protein
VEVKCREWVKTWEVGGKERVRTTAMVSGEKADVENRNN